MSVVIIGLGWVGKSVQRMIPDVGVHDPQLGRFCNMKTDVAFVCVPTPLMDDGRLDSSIVEDAVRTHKADVFIVRSTVNPGDCDRIREATGKRLVYQPEYLGETVAHPLFNESATPFMILGGEPADRRKAIELYLTVYNARVRIRETTLLEAEVIKLAENRAIAFKVAQCQELYDVCEAAGVNYYEIREAVYGDDPRFSLDHTFIYPDDRGFGGKCLSKDVPAFAAWAESTGSGAALTKAMIKDNERRKA